MRGGGPIKGRSEVQSEAEGEFYFQNNLKSTSPVEGRPFPRWYRRLNNRSCSAGSAE